MKRFFVWVVVFGLAAMGLSAQTPVTLRVTASMADVLSKPDMTGKIIYQYRAGSMLESSKKVGSFYEVSIGVSEGVTVTGYIHEQSVTVVQPGQPAVGVREVAPPPPAAPQPAVQPTPQPPMRQTYAPAAPMKTKSIGIGGGYAMVGDYGNGLAFGGSFYFGFSRNFGLDIGVQMLGSTYEGEDPPDINKLSAGKLSVMPVQLSLVGRFPVGTSIAPYIMAGAGYYLNKFTLNGDITSSWDALGFKIEEGLKNSIGFHFGAGLDFFITPSIALNLGATYCMAKAKGDWSITDNATSEVASGDLSGLKLDPLVFGARLKFFF